MAKHRSRIEVNAQGGIANVMNESPHGRITVRGDQRVGQDWDPAPLFAAIQDLRAALAASKISPEDKDEVEDQTVALEREAAVSHPNPGRLRRLGTALRNRLDQLSMNVLGRAIWENLPPYPDRTGSPPPSWKRGVSQRGCYVVDVPSLRMMG